MLVTDPIGLLFLIGVITVITTCLSVIIMMLISWDRKIMGK
jgi:hypothetical protein